MYITPDIPGILDQPVTTGPLATPAPSFTNETNTATSVPLIDQGAAALNGITQAEVNNFLSDAPTPQNPAAASGKPASQQVQADKAPWGIGIGLGIVALLVAWFAFGGGKRG